MSEAPSIAISAKANRTQKNSPVQTLLRTVSETCESTAHRFHCGLQQRRNRFTESSIKNVLIYLDFVAGMTTSYPVILSKHERRRSEGAVEGPRRSVPCHAASRYSHRFPKSPRGYAGFPNTVHLRNANKQAALQAPAPLGAKLLSPDRKVWVWLGAILSPVGAAQFALIAHGGAS